MSARRNNQVAQQSNDGRRYDSQVQPRHFVALAALIEGAHPDPRRAPVLVRLAAARLPRDMMTARTAGFTAGFAVAETACEVLRASLSSAMFARSPFSTVRPHTVTVPPLRPLPPGPLVFKRSTNSDAAAVDLRTMLPSDLVFILRLVLSLGCRPTEVDRLLQAPRGSTGKVIARTDSCLHITLSVGHRGPGHCWPAAWLPLAPPAPRGPRCPSCRATVPRLHALGRALRDTPSQACRDAALGVTREQNQPCRDIADGRFRIIRSVRSSSRHLCDLHHRYRTIAAILLLGLVVASPLISSLASPTTTPSGSQMSSERPRSRSSSPQSSVVVRNPAETRRLALRATVDPTALLRSDENHLERKNSSDGGARSFFARTNDDVSNNVSGDEANRLMFGHLYVDGL